MKSRKDPQFIRCGKSKRNKLLISAERHLREVEGVLGSVQAVGHEDEFFAKRKDKQHGMQPSQSELGGLTEPCQSCNRKSADEHGTQRSAKHLWGPPSAQEMKTPAGDGPMLDETGHLGSCDPVKFLGIESLCHNVHTAVAQASRGGGRPLQPICPDVLFTCRSMRLSCRHARPRATRNDKRGYCHAFCKDWHPPRLGVGACCHLTKIAWAISGLPVPCNVVCKPNTACPSKWCFAGLQKIDSREGFTCQKHLVVGFNHCDSAGFCTELNPKLSSHQETGKWFMM